MPCRTPDINLVRRAIENESLSHFLEGESLFVTRGLIETSLVEPVACTHVVCYTVMITAKTRSSTGGGGSAALTIPIGTRTPGPKSGIVRVSRGESHVR